MHRRTKAVSRIDLADRPHQQNANLGRTEDEAAIIARNVAKYTAQMASQKQIKYQKRAVDDGQ